MSQESEPKKGGVAVSEALKLSGWGEAKLALKMTGEFLGVVAVTLLVIALSAAAGGAVAFGIGALGYLFLHSLPVWLTGTAFVAGVGTMVGLSEGIFDWLARSQASK